MSHANTLDSKALKDILKAKGTLVEDWLATCLKPAAMHNCQGHATPPFLPTSLREAMEYSLMAGGKRLRPVLCLTTAQLCGLDAHKILPFACAIELIHTYSLIHDDLPAMDDDDLRRGKPSNHKQFGEAMAILAGDALLTDAFVFMSSVSSCCSTGAIGAENTLRALAYLGRAAGSHGMVGGQVLDMNYTGESNVSLEKLRTMHAMKTGALIQASCVCGALLAGAPLDVVTALESYGAALGTAFQIADDILDVTADTATLGKPAGSDTEQGKNTYPSLLGLEQSRVLAEEQKNKALEALAHLPQFTGEESAFLRGLATYVVARTS